jgi:hypothetical protein
MFGKVKINDPYNTMGAAPQKPGKGKNPDITGCEYCSTKGYLIGTTGKPDPNDLRIPIGPNDRQVRPGVWEIQCPKCKGKGYFTSR